MADARPAIARPKRSGMLSCDLAFLGSQMPQQNQISVAVAMNSMKKACGIETQACGLVTQTASPDISSVLAGVRVISNP